ncbi:acylglycerol kinase family protein [Sphingomonas sabuli]|uniref:Acylglycerol kinase family protein n=1 Tax=Sphingomonas sabuli TaxID=2764186 RepID=A0A7G9L052_9SPHN|nr:acylglycerol kinase family protein [Sphingomonas sabuli]QNM82001.1 acylglycerol kinase family protein [Sphingomonas sabuli]
MQNQQLKAKDTGTVTDGAPAARVRPLKARPRIALLSNPKSTGNIAQLSRIRAFCAEHPDVFHYEVEHVDQIGDALRSIACVRPKMLVINGGDGTVQAALTEIHNGSHFPDGPPPMAVIPSGKTNLIALDLGAHGDPIVALERLLDMAQGNLAEHLVARELIALRSDGSELPVIGMFLGGAGLADTMLYCRNKIYPLGLPNGLSHALTAVALLFRLLSGARASFLPPKASPLLISTGKSGSLTGRFTLLAVTTLDKLLLSGKLTASGSGRLKLLAIEERPRSLLGALAASLAGKLGRRPVRGVHVQETDEISIEGENSNVILDGEMFKVNVGKPIRLNPAQPLSFVRLAA